MTLKMMRLFSSLVAPPRCLALGFLLATVDWSIPSGLANEPGERFRLQFKQVTPEDSTVTDEDMPLKRIPQSIACATRLGDPFYVRHVDDGRQTIIQGILERDTEDVYRLTYVLDLAPLDSKDTPIRIHQGDAMAIELRSPTPIGLPIYREGHSPSATREAWLVTVSPWFRGIAFMDRSSTAIFRALDPDDKPAPDVCVGLYDVRNGWLALVPRLATDQNGLVSISEARDALTRCVVIAVDFENGWYAETRLDRTYADFTRAPVYTIRLQNIDAFNTKLLDDLDVVRDFESLRTRMERSKR